MKSTKRGSDSCATEIDLQVVFGSPSRNCVGSGVCKMLPTSFKVPEYLHHRICQAKLIRQQNGDLQLMVRRVRDVSSEPSLMSEGSILLEEMFHIPAWIGRQLGCGRVSLPAGKYKRANGEYIRLYFPFEMLIQRTKPISRVKYGNI